MCLATFAVMYDVIQSASRKEETDGGNDEEEEMQNTENYNSLTRNNCEKDWVSSGRGNRKQYYIQEGTNSYRTREILPCKAISVLSME